MFGGEGILMCRLLEREGRGIMYIIWERIKVEVKLYLSTYVYSISHLVSISFSVR